MTASEFIAQHTGICYCEAVIAPDGNIEYAIPGHVYKLIEVANESRDKLDRMMPMRAAPLHWLIEHTGYGAVWYDQFILPHHYTDKQIQVLQELCDAGIIADSSTGITSAEKTICKMLDEFEKTGDESLFEQMPKKKCIAIRKSELIGYLIGMEHVWKTEIIILSVFRPKSVIRKNIFRKDDAH